MKRHTAISFAALTVLLVGCVRATGPASGSSTASVPAAPASAAPATAAVTLALAEPSGAPGSRLTLDIQVADPVSLIKSQSSRAGVEYDAILCWDRCGPHGGVIAPLTLSAADSHRFTAAVAVPAYLNGVRLADGTHKLMLYCVTGEMVGCMEQPEATATFTLTGALPSIAWDALPAGDVQPAPTLGPVAGLMTDPANPLRQAECVGGSAAPGAKDRAHLRVTTDGGKSWTNIPLVGVNLGVSAGLSGCRAFALDPNADASYYLAGIIHLGGNYAPEPSYTRDGGKTWQVIAAPSGYDNMWGFEGFTVSASAMTAWYGRTATDSPPAVAGRATTDGGRSWQTVWPDCPAAGACTWAVPFRFRQEAAMWSGDGGKNWTWAQFQGKVITNAVNMPLTNLYVVSGTDLEMAGASTGEGDSLINGPIPLLRSTDGGQHWEWVDVPPPPGGWDVNQSIWMDAQGALNCRLNVTYRLARGSDTWAEQP